MDVGSGVMRRELDDLNLFQQEQLYNSSSNQNSFHNQEIGWQQEPMQPFVLHGQSTSDPFPALQNEESSPASPIAGVMTRRRRALMRAESAPTQVSIHKK